MRKSRSQIDASDEFLSFDVEFTGPQIMFAERSHELLAFPIAGVIRVLRHGLNCLHFDGDQVRLVFLRKLSHSTSNPHDHHNPYPCDYNEPGRKPAGVATKLR
ncbi:hypothetical protein DYB28_014548 [Aphanomyces astaci]|uniref:Uncharacterized protein n=1 Tax=Aphanomyces astaci TaxID=112090 RepID=A0A397AIC7_APHAT|nr:hypothetical protein DYB36_006111 [Aphanomyces astaci]RHY99750.1 hypothetical protein DYB31_011144 [Aphanomyces astaci]RLO05157.1 hypothetical protein DYB28_014548 [Aphanomyces astaci]